MSDTYVDRRVVEQRADLRRRQARIVWLAEPRWIDERRRVCRVLGVAEDAPIEVRRRWLGEEVE
ncbi:MAG TPA: hypothetical protein VKS25_07760 [Solirubrobacteraceae bacterium]|nr:hypothetical protein [Solirubrobacteraceae bacterium]